MWTPDPEVRLRYVQGMVRLSLWYVRLMLERSEIRPPQVQDALCQRVNLYRLTDFWDGLRDGDNGQQNPEWLRLVSQLAQLLVSTPINDVASAETQGLALLQPSLEARVPKDVGLPPVRPFACWTYELGWEGLGDRRGFLGKLRNTAHLTAVARRALGLAPLPSQHGVLHFMNVTVPRSPFEDVAELARTLLALLEELRLKHPQVGEVWCNTWLNDHPRFLELFPQVWRDSAVVAPAGNFRNWWGQFAHRDGDFNEAAARRFRESQGRFPYRALQCHAPVRAVAERLQQVVAEHAS